MVKCNILFLDNLFLSNFYILIFFDLLDVIKKYTTDNIKQLRIDNAFSNFPSKRSFPRTKRIKN